MRTNVLIFFGAANGGEENQATSDEQRSNKCAHVKRVGEKPRDGNDAFAQRQSINAVAVTRLVVSGELPLQVLNDVGRFVQPLHLSLRIYYFQTGCLNFSAALQ